MPKFPTPPGGEAALADLIRKIIAEQDAARAKAFRIPVRGADPPPSDPTNLWALEDGRLRFRADDGTVYNFGNTQDNDAWPDVPTTTGDPAASTGIDLWVNGSNGRLGVRMANGTIARFAPITAVSSSDSPTKTASATSSKPKPKPTRARTYRRTYSATWAATYQGNGNRRSTGDPTYYGRIDGTNGEQKAMVGFNDAAIRGDLAGATIRKVELWINNRHTYFNSGAWLHIGAHSNGTGPPNDYGGIVARSKSRRHWGKPEADWRTISSWFGTAFKTGRIAGIVIDQPGSNRAFYGYMNGTDTRLRITYSK